MKERIKRIIRFIANPRLILCLGLAWMVTNGWSYVVLGLGTVFQSKWMLAVSGSYLAFLWLPISPEKIVTVALAMLFLRLWFPNDEHTLGKLRELYYKLKLKLRIKKWKKKARQLEKRSNKNEEKNKEER